ncbi:GNAT family N-acetyltransferase [Curtobacterium sp. VKM Ac-2922]|uniref:GNAT family N-acetyltransferase n=1 Tax=Curtobacterium sp. VKM Ac-2922 TaxID=2929475 RepID=UPI001FB4234C|nr:GNAT family N-acetyltransferase [Curtobacterium sp. VKM Ac-2922]MCJ1712690.1 GNAT family N-acetyltransferase [Curtobacterium sp. VKM Ac-2922]
MHTIETVAPDSPVAAEVVRAYLADVASRWHGRTATDAEVEQALRDEPSDDLRAPSGTLFVAVEDGYPVGCTGVRFLGDVAELTKVFTLPTHRGRGIGAQLLRAAEDACRARGVGTLRLDTRAALTEACAMYERHGFERVAAFNEDPYSDRWYSKPITIG